MADDMLHFNVTVEGLGEKCGISLVLPTTYAMLEYDPEFVIDFAVDDVIKSLSRVLRTKLREALYG